MISSSRRIIKHPEASDTMIVEAYLPPMEQKTAARDRDASPRKPVFPQYTADGRRKVGETFYHEVFTEETLKKPTEQRPEKEPEQQAEESTDTALSQEEEAARQLAEEWKEEGTRLLEEARQEAGRILEEARQQAQKEQEEARQEGRRQGYEEGYQEGKRKAEAEFRDGIQEHLQNFHADMRQALKSVETAKENCLHTYLEELKDCAVAVGEKVIHISLKSSGEVIKQMIISATEKLKKTAWVKIYIDKYDYDMMMEADAGVVDELSHLSDNIKFIVMDKEDRGSCIIEMPEEIVDVSVNTQIENIKDILENIRI